MKLFLKIFLLILIFASTQLAQDGRIDEFGKGNSETLSATLSGLTFSLREKPTAKGYIVIYTDKKTSIGFPIRYGERIKKYLTKVAQIPSERFEIINNGIKDEFITQLWIVPNAGKFPLPESVKEEIDLTKTVKFDSFNFPHPLDGGCCIIDTFKADEKNASLDKFAQILKENSNLTAYLIFYGQYCTRCSVGDVFLDSTKEINHILRKEKNNLVKKHKIESSRIKTINGGYREWQEMELWFVPKSEKAPKATPKTFPKKKRTEKKNK
ncbi:MAG TPA: hypothetical protein PKY82_29670 [Pyrinomonadaceae bacterium]|nr:hypothetical protein [Pyrinomonadaceae bacterium]